MRILFLFIALWPMAIRAQIITTVAGNHIDGDTGDGGLATTASFHSPVYGACDKFGNYYLATGPGGKVRKISSSGVITTFAGIGTMGFSGDSGPATAAEFHSIQAVTVDSLGNVFIADSRNNRIRKVDIATEIVTTIAGTGVASYGGDGGPATAALLSYPAGLQFDKTGNLYIADFENRRVRKIEPGGIITTVAGTGMPGYSGDGGPATAAQIGAWDLCVDDTGNIFIADFNCSVRKVDLGGTITTVVGNGISGSSGDGGPATAASTKAAGITIDKNHNLYISEYTYSEVRVVNSTGVISALAGDGIAGYSGDGGPATASRVNYPAGICFDTSGNMYIADSHSWVVRKVCFDSLCVGSSLTVNEKINFACNIYPNPTTNELTVQGPETIISIEITNLLGDTMYSAKSGKNKTTINISNLTPGMYFLKASDIDGNTVTRKIIKQ